MRFWFDTEFLEDGKTIELISIGVVAEDGRKFYAETPDAEVLARKTEWLAVNVYPHLARDRRYIYDRWQIANFLREFMGRGPEIWAYYSAYDWVVLCQLFGRMIDHPTEWPMFCRDIKQLAWELGDPKLPAQRGAEHNALADAEWAREAWQFLEDMR